MKKQIGGDHYSKRTIQPWDIIDEYGLNYYEGNVIKYVLRHRDKNGIEDLRKASHYLEKIIADMEKTNNISQMQTDYNTMTEPVINYDKHNHFMGKDNAR